MNRSRSGAERWQKRVWLAMMLLFGAVCPGLIHAQFQRLWEIRTDLLFNGEFHHGNYYAPARSNYNRTITLYRLDPIGTLIPLWSYTEPDANAPGLSPNLDVDSGAERIFLQVIWNQRVDIWALGLDGTFRWVVHSARSPYPSYSLPSKNYPISMRFPVTESFC